MARCKFQVGAGFVPAFLPVEESFAKPNLSVLFHASSPGASHREGMPWGDDMELPNVYKKTEERIDQTRAVVCQP